MIEKFRWYLAIHFAILGVMTAFLVSIDEGTLRLPMLVGIVAITSLVFTDRLEWFQLHRYLGYIGMILGAVLALSNFFTPTDSGRLYSIATMLAYAEIVLYLQKKTQRIFEQLGVFILLELVVAALLTDKVLFGLLLIPVLAVSLSTMILFTHYIALATEGKNPVKERLTLQYLWNVFLNRVPEVDPNKPVPISLKPVTGEDWSKRLNHTAWVLQAAPLAVSVLGFALLFFYLLPRTNLDSYSVPSFSSPVVGFTEQMKLNQFGEVLRSDQLVMRVSFRNSKTNEPYEIQQAPYLRGVVLEDYTTDMDGSGVWRQRREVSSVPLRDLPSERFVAPRYRQTGDWVNVRFSLEKTKSSSLFCVAPTCVVSAQGFRPHFIPEDWRIHSQDLVTDTMEISYKKISYTIGTGQFRNGLEHSIVPEASDFFSNEFSNIIQYSGLTSTRYVALTRMESKRFPGLIALAERVATKAGEEANSAMGFALNVESFFSSGAEYQYTLDLTSERNRKLDAIEDFIVNHKKGHCQYFASAMAMMLRSRKIPTRVVVGYRPNEFNELGKFFTVRQNDAHAWVEAYFTKEQLDESKLYSEQDTENGGWVRFDPTPPGDESNSGGVLRRRRAAPDFFQEFWNRNILEMNQSSQSGTIYDAITDSNNPYSSTIRSLQRWINRFDGSPDDQSMETNAEWFSIPIAAWFIGLGSVISIVWWVSYRQLGRLIPLFKIQRYQAERLPVTVKFFERCLHALARLGFRRAQYQTPKELTTQAALWLHDVHHRDAAAVTLSQLTDDYYKIRFGNVEAQQNTPSVSSDSNTQTVNSAELDATVEQFQKAIKDIPKRTSSN
jgi:transglutaminase-like putative cysteine protease